MKSKSVLVFAAAVVLVTLHGPAMRGAQTPAQAVPPVDARIWIGRAAEIEAYLRTAPMERFEDVPVGVTKPKRAFLPPGGLVESVAWKPIRPDVYNGYWESYKSEIAAYELDKLLGLNMVPPTVEKVYRGERGAAILWASPTGSLDYLSKPPGLPAALEAAWARQIVKAKMFHNLINDIDANKGNWLADPAWNLILIDFSRCFTSGRAMVHEFTRVDAGLWDRMKALTEASLTKAIGTLVNGKGELRAVIQRRDRMQEIIDQLVKEHGEAYVFMRGD